MEELPQQIALLVSTLRELPGVIEVDCGAIPLGDFDMEQIMQVEFGDLPHAALLRSGGGLSGEAMGQFFIRLDRSDASWTTLEFLAWQVRDCSRSGKRYQMRPLALPPVIDGRTQLGETLNFVIELFQDGLDTNQDGLLYTVGEFVESIRSSIDLYGLQW